MGGGFFFPILLFFPIQANRTILRQCHRLGRGNVKKRSVRDERKDGRLRMAIIREGQNQLSRIEPEEGELIRTGFGHYRSVCGNSRNVGGEGVE